MPVPEAFFHALRRRLSLCVDRATDALRLLDGAGDGREFDGFYLDDFAGRWLFQTSRPGQIPPDWLRSLPADVAPRSIYWKRLDSRDRHQSPPARWHGESIDAPFAIRENGLTYRIDFRGGYSQGIFLDQRDNRRILRQQLGPGKSLLNCFAYTCAFSVVAAAAGARTVSVDLSRASLNWGKENFRLNDLDPDAECTHEFHAGDVFQALAHRAKRGLKFDAVILDPPTFSRDRKGKVFRVEDDFGKLVALAAGVLAPGGVILCSTNSRQMTADRFRRLALSELSGRWRTRPAPMPPDFTGVPYLQALWLEA